MFERYSRRLESCTQLKWGCHGVIFFYILIIFSFLRQHDSNITLLKNKMFDIALPLIKFLNSVNGPRRCQSCNVPKRDARQPGS